MVCEYLELPASVEVFLWLFVLTNPSKEGRHKKGFMSFRAAQGRRIFGVFEDSFHGFKDKFFNVWPSNGQHPFCTRPPPLGPTGPSANTGPSSSGVVPPEVEPSGGGSDVAIVENPHKRKLTSSPEGSLTVVEKNFDAGGFIDSQLMYGTDEFFHDGDLGAQSRWIYRCMLRATTIAGKAEPILTQARALDGKYCQSLREVESLISEVGVLKEKLADSAGKLKTFDVAVARGETVAAQTKITVLEARLEEAVKSAKDAKDEVAGLKGEVAGLKKKNKETVRNAREVISGTEEVIKAQVKLLSPDFDTSAIGAFKTIRDGQIVDIPEK
ncbi:uncharacterized protein DS421_17g595840 [Arachis hypogaea]|nr:uncharacterized protein DS421_17g595840 [Arachis hypogaea]